MRDQDARGDGDPGVSLAARPDREREPSAGAKHSPRLAEGGCRIRHEHVAPAAEDAVDRIVRELDLLGVEDAVLHVRQAELGTSPAGDFGHRRAEVARDQTTTLAEDCRNLESDLSLAGRELEHHVSGHRRELADEPFGHGRRGLLPLRPHALPARGHRSPVLEPGLALLIALHGAIVDAPERGVPEQENTEPVAPSSTIPTSFPPGLAASAYDPQEWLRPRSAPYSVHGQPMRGSPLAQAVLNRESRKERNKP